MGGRFAPINLEDLGKIDEAVREVLQDIGMSEAPGFVVDAITKRGGKLRDNGRLTYSGPLIDDALAGFRRDFVLHGQIAGHDLLMSDRHVHVGTGGAAPQIVDLETGQYRESRLQDLYDAARLVDTLDHVHFFSRSMVARDMENEDLLDINTAYASLAGTTKHVMTSATFARNVQPIADMCFAIAGSQEAFVERPFLSLNINHVVSPLRFAEDACGVMAEAARLGIPMHANTFGQLGASTPVTIAGSVMQTTAETLAGMIFAWVMNPDARVTFGARPMITDLRTGAMTGGSGEQAVLMAAAMQMANFYNLPNTCIAGATDSKIADAQSGYEKCLSVTLAAQAGSNMITQACGMQASLLACAFESYVIDNDMLGGIMRSIGPVEVSDETMSAATVAQIVQGDGHYLGHKDTLQRMETDFLYPDLADRRTPAEWEGDGSLDIRNRARDTARSILKDHFPTHIPDSVDASLRANFDIRLPRTVMGRS